MKIPYIVSILLILLLVVSGCQQTSISDTATQTSLIIGNKAGNTVSLHSFRGSPVILNFWNTG